MFASNSTWAFSFRQIFSRVSPGYRRRWINFRSALRRPQNHNNSNNRHWRHDTRFLLAFTSAAGFSFKEHGISDERMNSAADRLDEFDARNEKEQGWEPLVEEENFRAFRRPVPGPYEMYEYKCAGTYFDISPRTFLDSQNDLKYRKEWDGNIISLDLLKEEDGHELLKWVSKYPYPLYPREYIYARRTWISEDEKVVVVESEVVPEEVYPSSSDSKNVRVGTYTSRMAIRAHKEWNDCGVDYILIYSDNPEANIPKYIYNWIIDRGGPYFLKQVHSAALEIEKSGRSIVSTLEKMKKMNAESRQNELDEQIKQQAPLVKKIVTEPVQLGTDQGSTADIVDTRDNLKEVAAPEVAPASPRKTFEEEESGLRYSSDNSAPQFKQINIVSRFAQHLKEAAYKISQTVQEIPKGF